MFDVKGCVPPVEGTLDKSSPGAYPKDMAPPLAAVVALFLALPAHATPKTYETAMAELSRDFATGADVTELDASGQPAAFLTLRDQAKYVQAGLEPGVYIRLRSEKDYRQIWREKIV